MFRKVAIRLVEKELSTMGVHRGGVNIMSPKATIIPLKIFAVRSPAANIIKQECLAIGAECATPEGAISCSEKYVDILLMGTLIQYKILREKLSSMADWFNVKSVIRDLELFLTNIEPITYLADGKKITYENMHVMGILNVTPDSFYGNSRVSSEEILLKRAATMLEDGATILDVGGESTRPGSDSVTMEEEQERVIPAISALHKAFPENIISVDTYHSETARLAIEAGAHIINDITAGTFDENMLLVAKEYQAPIVLMHMRGMPKTMQENVEYKHIVDEVAEYLFTRAKAAMDIGLTREQIILDPGIGFGKDVEGNLALLRDLEALTCHGLPVLLAASRKGFIGKVLSGISVEERLEGTLATTARAFTAGAQMVRVHDVKEHFRFIKMLEAMA